MTALISNPPYNMKWKAPDFALMQARFAEPGTVPPENNANFAFLLTALDESDAAVFILPKNILTPTTKPEQDILRWMVDKNYIEAVITCPDNMFESTSIATCILVLNTQKKTTFVEMIDISKKCVTETREQNGQFGGVSHINRTYQKEINVFTDEQIDDAIDCIKKQKNDAGYCKSVSLEDIKANEYKLAPARYIESAQIEPKHREYKDIVADLNRIRRHKNACKLTINETLARSLDLDPDLFRYQDRMLDPSFQELAQRISGQKIIADNYFTATKNKNEMRFENTDKETLSNVLMMTLQGWEQNVFYLNTEENRLLAELRDALLPDLMNGKITVQNNQYRKAND